MSDLLQKRCRACEGEVDALGAAAASRMLAEVPGWEIDPTGKEIRRDFQFENYDETMAFVNATAWISHRENHHPDLEVGYRHCLVRYSTHSVKGLSENDFICAAKVNALVT